MNLFKIRAYFKHSFQHFLVSEAMGEHSSLDNANINGCQGFTVSQEFDKIHTALSSDLDMGNILEEKTVDYNFSFFECLGA